MPVITADVIEPALGRESTVHFIRCDGCEVDSPGQSTAVRALFSAVGYGWTCAPDGRWLCPTCITKPRCDNPMPASAGAGHWREWHRGHGCPLDPDAPSKEPTDV